MPRISSLLALIAAVCFASIALSSVQAQTTAPPAATAHDAHHAVASVNTASADAAAVPDNGPPHPLDPLTPEEISVAVAAGADLRIPQSIRLVSIVLAEPDKPTLARYEASPATSPIPRQAALVLLDHADGLAYEATVDLAAHTLARLEKLPAGTQPAITGDELAACEDAARSSPEFRAALKKRGVEDMSLVMIDGWSAGHYGNEPPEDAGRRLVRALIWVRASPTDEGYAHPISGLVTVLDLNRGEVVRVEDYGVVPVPKTPANWTGDALPPARTDLKPLEVVQPDGPSFTLRGHEVRWQKWSLRIGFNPREGLTLHNIAYDNRPVLARASIAEMAAKIPYADPNPAVAHKCVFDVGEYGLGAAGDSLELGCDCLGTIRYLDASLADAHGEVVTIKNAICIHEEDAGLLWKHTDWRNGASEVRRSRRLAVSLIATVGNYDYGYYWYFYQDGSIQMEVKLTGIMNTQALADDENSPYGTEIMPRLLAPDHQHFFAARLDFDVDGAKNAVSEVNTQGQPAGDNNPLGNAFAATATPLADESSAQRNASSASARFWRIASTDKKNALGTPTAYRLCLGENSSPFGQSTWAINKRAGLLAHNLWVTQYAANERYPAGEYPNQNPGGEGLPAWTKANRNLAGADVVLWYTFGHTHIPRPEDWPIMPTASLGFMLRPDGFFTANPALDVPPPLATH